mgnify:CR=1 FL=1
MTARAQGIAESATFALSSAIVPATVRMPVGVAVDAAPTVAAAVPADLPAAAAVTAVAPLLAAAVLILHHLPVLARGSEAAASVAAILQSA